MFRRATATDVPRMTELIAAADLPPLFIEEYLDGFVTAERAGKVIACGGLEIYDDCGVIRSVVVDPDSRGLGLGLQLAETLMADARTAGVGHIYLLTMDAWNFWLRLGFADVTFDEWREAARACWQYQFCSQNTELLPGIHTMWRTADQP
jgi:N-acetylglutamate synthase-like GNAT family acetyltransferase